MKTLFPILLLLVFAACQKQEQPAADAATPDRATSAETTTTATAPPATPAGPTGIEIGSVLPAYSSAYLTGGTGTYDPAQKRGTVQLVNIWATWCGPCRYEIPELQAIHDRYAPRGFEVVGVSVDETGADGVRQFVEEQKMTYPVVLDEKGTLADMLQTSVLPTTILLDRDGKIVWKKLGAIMPEDKELEAAIETALGAEKV